jgi:hypothetical protein
MTIVEIGHGTAGPENLEVWPVGQRTDALPGAPSFALTRFADTDAYHPALVAQLMRLAHDPAVAVQQARAIGGTKVYHIHRMQSAELAFICARAAAMFRRVLGVEAAVIDMSWANIYGKGDYSLPHSHLRAQASVVYCVDAGDPDPTDPWSGQFCFVDPRLAACCQTEPGHMTHPVMPGLSAGTMLIFPGQAVHCVGAYGGTRPRITLSWNINTTVLSGEPSVSIPRQFGEV